MKTTPKSKFKGYDIIYVNDEWVFCDTGEPTVGNKRCCGSCSRDSTKEDHDGCLGTLKGVMNACCGHGVTDDKYVQFLDGFCVRGEDAEVVLGVLKKYREKGDE